MSNQKWKITYLFLVRIFMSIDNKSSTCNPSKFVWVIFFIEKILSPPKINAILTYKNMPDYYGLNKNIFLAQAIAQARILNATIHSNYLQVFSLGLSQIHAHTAVDMYSTIHTQIRQGLGSNEILCYFQGFLIELLFFFILQLGLARCLLNDPCMAI